MIVSDEFEPSKATDLADQIIELIKKNADLTHGEALFACLCAIGELLMSISCPDCRELAAKNMKLNLPYALDQALECAGKEPSSECIH